jgi:hypothetical protein
MPPEEQPTTPAAVLPYQLDPQTEFVLERKFLEHSAHGRCHKTATQSIPDTTVTKVVWEVNDFASEITWDSSSNRFIIRRAGSYLVTASIAYLSTTANIHYRTLTYKNGAEYNRFTALASNSGTQEITATVTDTLDLLKGDYIEIYTQHLSGSSKNIGGASNLCYFSIARIN